MAEKLNKDEACSINDGNGLVLLMKSSGVKTWRFITDLQENKTS